jgi:chemotaxis protein MotD
MVVTATAAKPSAKAAPTATKSAAAEAGVDVKLAETDAKTPAAGPTAAAPAAAMAPVEQATAKPIATSDTEPQATPIIDAPAQTPRQSAEGIAPQAQPAAGASDPSTMVATPQPSSQPSLPAAATASAVPTTQWVANVATNAAVPLNRLGIEIAATAQSGASRFDIRLDPAELGRIDVRIEVDRHGNVTSHLTVEKPETLVMLRNDAPQLQRALDDAGLKTSDGGLQFSLRDQSSGQNNNNPDDQSPRYQRLAIGEEEVVPAAVVGRNYGRMLGAAGGVDIRV